MEDEETYGLHQSSGDWFDTAISIFYLSIIILVGIGLVAWWRAI
jgi:hypothetical protein